MLNDEFLNELLGKEDVSLEDKVKSIVAEHEADTRGLLAKRDELLGSEKKLKEKISAYETAKGEYETKISGLEQMLEKANSGDQKVKEYYETKLADLQKKYDTDISTISAEKDQYKTLHLTALRDKAIEEGCKDINFISGLKKGFIARVLSENDFQPDDSIDGQLKFLNKEHHTIEEAIHAFAMTQEGKAYIANPSTGGGARGSSSNGSGGTGNKTMSRSAYDELQKSDPEKAMKFFREGGRLVD